VAGTRRTQCCLLLLVGALGSTIFSLRSQDVPFEPRARYSSAPVGEPKTLLEYPTHAVRFPITLGPNAFLSFSPAGATTGKAKMLTPAARFRAACPSECATSACRSSAKANRNPPD
jgi:hypothetical protein